jgi:hypothetical protein
VTFAATKVWSINKEFSEGAQIVEFRASKREIESQIQGLVKKNYDLFKASDN